MDLVKDIVNHMHVYVFDLAIKLSRDNENIRPEDVLSYWCEQQNLDISFFDEMFRLNSKEQMPGVVESIIEKDSCTIIFCKHIFKRGPNKDNQCPIFSLPNSSFCKRHTKKQ